MPTQRQENRSLSLEASRVQDADVDLIDLATWARHWFPVCLLNILFNETQLNNIFQVKVLEGNEKKRSIKNLVSLVENVKFQIKEEAFHYTSEM